MENHCTNYLYPKPNCNSIFNSQVSDFQHLSAKFTFWRDKDRWPRAKRQSSCMEKSMKNLHLSKWNYLFPSLVKSQCMAQVYLCIIYTIGDKMRENGLGHSLANYINGCLNVFSLKDIMNHNIFIWQHTHLSRTSSSFIRLLH